MMPAEYAVTALALLDGGRLTVYLPLMAFLHRSTCVERDRHRHAVDAPRIGPAPRWRRRRPPFEAI
jgi:hypothetical protein